MLKHKSSTAFDSRALHFYTFKGLFLSSIYEAIKKNYIRDRKRGSKV